MDIADDAFDLERFVTAQDAGGTYDAALAELRAGLKRGHWMWFVFPQLGLGHSEMARRYALQGLAEARAYLAHPVLGPRLVQCAQAMAEVPGEEADAVLGPVDAMKLRSCMTLFAEAEPGQPVFREVLDNCFAGERDPATLRLLERGTSGLG